MTEKVVMDDIRSYPDSSGEGSDDTPDSASGGSSEAGTDGRDEGESASIEEDESDESDKPMNEEDAEYLLDLVCGTWVLPRPRGCGKANRKGLPRGHRPTSRHGHRKARGWRELG